MMDNLLKTIQFINQLNQLKLVNRSTLLPENGREENSAEHSWHVALSAIALEPYADDEVAIDRVVQLLLIHDVGEIGVGDLSIFAEGYDDLDKNEEREAARAIFDQLPEPYASDFLALWDEFEAAETPDAIFANAIDRFIPPLINLVTEGAGWKRDNVSLEAIQSRLLPPVKAASQSMHQWLDQALKEADEAGFIPKK